MDKPDEAPVARSCDGCDLCCTAVMVWDMPGGPKPGGVRCSHLAGAPGHSCSIYATRPDSCRSYFCMWRGGPLLPAELRPVDCGFIFSMMAGDPGGPLVITIQRDPARHDAANQPRYRKLFFELAKRFNAIVVLGEGDDAEYLYSPRGNLFSRRKWPKLFTDDGKVGLPKGEFLGPQLSVQEKMIRLLEPMRLD